MKQNLLWKNDDSPEIIINSAESAKSDKRLPFWKGYSELSETLAAWFEKECSVFILGRELEHHCL